MAFRKLLFQRINTGLIKNRTAKISLLVFLSLGTLNIFAARIGQIPGSLPLPDSYKSTKPLIRLVAGYENDPASFDPFVIYFDAMATHNFDGQYDALKIFNTDINVTNYYVFSADERKLSISGVPSDGISSFDLGSKTEKNADVVFKIRDIDESLQGKRIILRDKHTGIEQELGTAKEYSVYLIAGHYTERFILDISDATVGTHEVLLNEDVFKAYSSDGILKIEIADHHKLAGTLSLISLSGKVLIKESYTYPGQYELNFPLDSGIYFVSFTSDGNICTRKLYIGTR